MSLLRPSEKLLVLDQQSRALIDGEAEFSRFRLLLHLAHEKKDEAKYALIAHIEAHQLRRGLKKGA